METNETLVGGKEYVRAVATDIEKTFREKFNWVPASELPEIKAKHEYYKSMAVRK